MRRATWTSGRLRWRAAVFVLLAIATPAFAGTVYYDYDAQGRVTSATYPDGTVITYAYDPAGNRTSYVVTAPGAPVTGPVSAVVGYDSTNNPIALNITGGAPVSVAVSTQATSGTATASGTSITYTPTSGYSGADSFQYTASNTTGTSLPGAVSITVSPASSTWGYFTWGSGTWQ